jgi:beta-phosphoglucomutase-like phosphatase (HAD superfamily)
MFDFDNTLVDSLKFWYDSIDRKAFKFFGLKQNKEFSVARRGLTNREICECFVKHSGSDNLKVNDVIKFWHEKMIFNYQNKIKMRTIKKTPLVNKKRAIEIAMNHNIVSREIAEKYTDSELKEILKVLKLKANF